MEREGKLRNSQLLPSQDPEGIWPLLLSLQATIPTPTRQGGRQPADAKSPIVMLLQLHHTNLACMQAQSIIQSSLYHYFI